MTPSDLLLCSAAVQLALISTPVFAAPTAVKQVLAREHQYSMGILHGDTKELSDVFADSFVDTSESGVLRSKQELIALIRRQQPPISLSESDRRIQIYGDVAVVTVKFEVKGVVGGKPYDAVGRATDVWIKEKNNWYCIAAHSSPIGG